MVLPLQQTHNTRMYTDLFRASDLTAGPVGNLEKRRVDSGKIVDNGVVIETMQKGSHGWKVMEPYVWPPVPMQPP